MSKEIEEIKLIIKSNTARNRYTKHTWVTIRDDELFRLNELIKELENKQVWVVHFSAQNSSAIEGVYKSEQDAKEAAGDWCECELLEVEQKQDKLENNQ